MMSENRQEKTLLDLQRELLEAAEALSAAPKPGRLRYVFQMIASIDRFAGALDRAKSTAKGQNAMLQQAEDVAERLALQVDVLSERPKEAKTSWVDTYRAIWREHLPLFLMVATLFIASGIIGWCIGLRQPDYALLIIGQQKMEQIIQKDAWFSAIQKNPLLIGLSIAWNNIRVAVMVFTASSLLGLGGLALLIYNGVLFGCMLGFCLAHDFDGALVQFVLGHGPLELSIIVAATFAGMLFGRAFYLRPLRQVAQHMSWCTRDAMIVLCGCVPWLMLAACIEAFVSPFEYFSQPARLGIGLVAAAGFWGWTFWPKRGSVFLVRGQG